MSPMSEIHHPPSTRPSIRNGLAPRPNSVLEVVEPLMISSVPPLSPPPDFHTGKYFIFWIVLVKDQDTENTGFGIDELNPLLQNLP